MTLRMKAPEVHKLMSRIWTPFLCEHGLQRTSKTRKGWGSLESSEGVLTIGYELGVGYYDWTGNSIELQGEVRTATQRHVASLEPSAVLPQSGTYPIALRNSLRMLGVRRLSELLEQGQVDDPASPNYVILHESFHDELRAANQNPRYVPPFRYLDEDDLRTWCKIVLPHIPECITTLMSFLHHD